MVYEEILNFRFTTSMMFLLWTEYIYFAYAVQDEDIIPQNMQKTVNDSKFLI